MPLTIQSNISALRAERALAANTASLKLVFERLSSGQRINRASDDAAGLAIAQSLNADARVFTQGIKNINDGLSLLSIADGAISELSSIVVRIRELSSQSANGTLSATQRKALDEEAQALSKEFTRIAQSTEFNGFGVLNGEVEEFGIQAGYGLSGTVLSSIGGAMGDGTYTEAGTFQTQALHSSALAFGDFNGDGVLDLVTAGYTGWEGEASVLLGNGDGTFSPLQTLQAEGNYSNALSVGDVNGDGVLDLVTAGFTGIAGEVTVFLGEGDGTFAEVQTYRTEHWNTLALSLGDLNGDGVLDLVTAGDGLTGGEITVGLGGEDGTFSQWQTLGAGYASLRVELGDLNGDGVLDIVASGTDGYTGEVRVYLNNGDGTFTGGLSIATANDARALSLGDLNGDGMFDIVTAGTTYEGDPEVAIFLGKQDGTLAAGQTFLSQGGNIRAVSLGDMNGDGVLDIATTSSGIGARTNIFTGRGDGTFIETGTYVSAGSTFFASSLADLNGDGVLDLTTAGAFAAVFLSNTKAGTSAILPFDLRTRAGALQSMSMLDRKLEQLNEQRVTIGAFQSRLGVANNTLAVSTENIKSAESRIKDADVAEEASRLVRLGVLQQASAAILAQANVQPELALALLD